MKLNKYFLISMIFFNSHLVFAEADTPCATNGSGEITTNPLFGSYTDCSIQPTIQRVIFLKASLCTAVSIAMPTTSTEIDTSSCTTIWENPAGESVDIQLGVETSLARGDDDVNIPSPGIYKTVYLEMKPYFGISASKKFAQAMKDTSGNAAGGGRVFCKSLSVTRYSFKNTNPTASLCSTTEGIAGITNNYFNSLGDNSGVPDATYIDGNLSAALITSDRKLIPAATLNQAGTEDKLVAWFVQDTVVTSTTNGFTVGFGNQRGASVELENLWVKSFSAGPFNINLTPF